MGILLTLFAFQQAYADTTWLMYGGNLENTHYQKMVGAMEIEPYVKWSYVTGHDMESFGAAVADVDGVAGMEVVVGSYDHKVYCLDGVTGTVKWSYVTGGLVYSSPVVVDVDGVIGMEVVVGSYDAKVYCLYGVTGLVKWSHYARGWVHRGISVADMDGDSQSRGRFAGLS
jgi:outer membrane protein assembly factor BamB